MVTLDLLKIKDEILNLLRNSDVISKTIRGVSTKTDNLNITSTVSFVDLSEEPVKNIRSVIKNSVTLEYGIDYTLNLYGTEPSLAKRVNFTTDLVNGDTVDIEFDYTTTIDSKNNIPVGDRIYADLPQVFVTNNRIPRINFEIVSISTNNRSSNDNLQQKNLLLEFRVLGKGTEIDKLAQDVYNVLFINKKNLNCLNLLRPSGYSSKEIIGDNNNNIYGQTFTYTAPTEFEIENG